MGDTDIRFIIITVPPEEIEMQICEFRNPLAKLFKSNGALAYPPHITLRTGAVVPRDSIDELVTGLEKTLDGCNPFTIQTNGVYTGKYEQDSGMKPIVALNIAMTPELKDLNARLLSYSKYRKSNRLGFWPHISLLYNDLSWNQMEKFRLKYHDNAFMKNFYLSWQCDNVSIYSYSNKACWCFFTKLKILK